MNDTLRALAELVGKALAMRWLKHSQKKEPNAATIQTQTTEVAPYATYQDLQRTIDQENETEGKKRARLPCGLPRG